MTALEKEVDEVKKDIVTVKENQNSQTKENVTIKSNISTIQQKLENNTNNVKVSVMTEIKNRESRKNNIVIHGVAETNGSESIELKRQKENAEVLEILKAMKIDTQEVESDIVYRRRLGKIGLPGKNRPLLICFRTNAVRDRVLRNAVELRNGTKSHISIRPDLTAMEREEDNTFRNEVATLNQSNLSDEVGDFKWRVAGPPGMLRKVKERDIIKWRAAENARKQRIPPPPPLETVRRSARNPAPIVEEPVADNNNEGEEEESSEEEEEEENKEEEDSDRD